MKLFFGIMLFLGFFTVFTGKHKDPNNFLRDNAIWSITIAILYVGVKGKDSKKDKEENKDQNLKQ